MTRPHRLLRPSDITAIRDTREQRPLDLDLPTVDGTLVTGDYSVSGLEHLVAVERKSLPDLVMCVGVARERFEREIQRLRAYDVKVLVVEASWEEVEAGGWRSQVTPASVLGSLHSWIARGITVELAGNRERAARMVSRILFSAARERWRQLSSLCDSLKLAGSDK